MTSRRLTAPSPWRAPFRAPLPAAPPDAAPLFFLDEPPLVLPATTSESVPFLPALTYAPPATPRHAAPARLAHPDRSLHTPIHRCRGAERQRNQPVNPHQWPHQTHTPIQSRHSGWLRPLSVHRYHPPRRRSPGGPRPHPCRPAAPHRPAGSWDYPLDGSPTPAGALRHPAAPAPPSSVQPAARRPARRDSPALERAAARPTGPSRGLRVVRRRPDQFGQPSQPASPRYAQRRAGPTRPEPEHRQAHPAHRVSQRYVRLRSVRIQPQQVAGAAVRNTRGKHPHP